MEIALDAAISTYSGGLGILAGDTVRSAADLEIPFVAVTLAHRQGYFRQKLDQAGNQIEEEDKWLPEKQVERVHGESWETHEVPQAIAKIGAWLQDKLPGQDPFVKPWMIDRANDHYAIDISRARELLGWQPKRSLRETLPKMVEALKADPAQWFEDNGLTPPAGESGSASE